MASIMDASQKYVLALFRVVIGLLFACHGVASLFGVMGGADSEGGTVDATSWPYGWAAVIHLAAGALVILGLCTRSFAVVGSGAMAYAYFTEHQDLALWPMENGGELAAVYAWAFLLLVVSGPGAWAVDNWVREFRNPSGV
ncbi:DoxX family protein [Streptomyces werraensis]|uniref:DoxX family protein n=1 Tax=Streptomyces werraensis TaxID=68284 RepID=UPI001CE27FC0